MKKSTIPKVLVTTLVVLFTTLVTKAYRLFAIKKTIAFVLLAICVNTSIAQVVTTFAGSGVSGIAGGIGTAAQLRTPYGLAFDGSGNLYFTEASFNLVRKITPTVLVDRFAGGTRGTADGLGLAAQFDNVQGVTVDASNNIYVSDASNHTIRKITPAGAVTTFAGNAGTRGSVNGTGTAAEFFNPRGLAIDALGNIYVADWGNCKIRKVTPAGVVTTFAGSGTPGSANGTGSVAEFQYPTDLAIDAAGNIYVVDNKNYKIRKITPGGVVTTFAGSGTSGTANGTGTSAQFKDPQGIAIDKSGNLYVTDNLSRVRKITPTGVVSNFVGAGFTGSANGTDANAQFNNPIGLAVDASNKFLYVADGSNFLIRRVTLPLDATINKTDATCSNASNGGARAIPTSTCGTGFSYLWTPGNMTTDTVSNLIPGTYSVRIICGSDTANKTVVIGSPTIAGPSVNDQSFCNGATVADLVATGTNIKWYSSFTGGTALASTTPLINGYYYASQTVNGCESDRSGGEMTVLGSVAPTADTTFCNEGAGATLKLISLNGASQTTYNWTSTSASLIAASGTSNSISFFPNNPATTVLKDTVMVTATYTYPSTYAITDGTYSFKDTVGATNITSSFTSGNVSTAIPIGFTFNFFGTNYTNMYVSKLGSVGFAPGSGANEGSGTSNPTIYGQLRAWGAFSTQTRIKYQLKGTAPNRQMVVTFDSLTAPTANAGGALLSNPTGRSGKFQIIMNETSNTVEIAVQSAPSLNFTSSGNPFSTSNQGIQSSGGSSFVAGRQNGNWITVVNESKIFTATPGASCPASRDTFVVTILPTIKLDSIADQSFCQSATTTAINFSTPITGTTVGYKWSNSNTAIGLPASGTGNIPSFTTSATIQTATITVTPYIIKSGTDTCFGTARTFKIFSGTPAPTASNQTLCNGATVADLVATGTGIKWYATATGGTELPSTTPLINNTAYYASQTIAGCESGTRAANTVAINGKVGPIADTTFCNEGINGSSYTINFNGSSGTTYNWTSTSASLIAASGTTGSVSFQANNPGTSVIKDTVMVSGNYSSPFKYTISNGTYAFKDTVGSTYVTSQMTSGTGISSAIPIGFSFNYYGGNFTQAYITKFGNLAFANTTIGNGNIILGQSREWVYGTGSKASYKVSGTAPNRQFVVTFTSLEAPASITTTTTGPPPAYPQTQNTPITSSGTGTFQIILNETSNLIETAIKSAPTATYSYSPSVGVPVTSFSLRGNYQGVEDSLKTNNFYIRNNTDWVSITNESKIFTPVLGTSCPASRDTFVVTVLPTAIVDSIADQIYCTNSTTTAINFTTPVTGGVVGYKWSNNNPAIGLPAIGFGNIPSFTTSSSVQVATIGVSPYILKSANDTCFTGELRIFKIFSGTPAPNASNQSLCSGAKVADLVATGTNIKWYATATGGVALSSTAPLLNATNYYASQTINGCESNVRAKDSVTLLGSINPIADTTFCNQSSGGSTSTIPLTGSAGNNYTWTATQNGTGVASTGTGNVSFVPNNTGNSVKKDSVIVTATYNNSTANYTVSTGSFNWLDTTSSTKITNAFNTSGVVNNIPIGFDFKYWGVTKQQVKIGKQGLILFSANNDSVLYAFNRIEDAWDYSTASISYKTIGTAPNRKFFVSFDSLKAPATINTTFSYSDPSNPSGMSTETVATTVRNQSNMGGNFQMVLHETSNIIETNIKSLPEIETAFPFTYTQYPYNQPAGYFTLPADRHGLTARTSNVYVSGRAPSPRTIDVIHENKTFTPTVPLICSSKDTFYITVNPTPIVDSIANQTFCSSSTTSAISFTTPITGTTVGYKWVNSKPSIGLAASGMGNVPSFTASSLNDTATISVTPFILKGTDTCFGTVRTFKIFVGIPPTPATSNQTLCSGATVADLLPTGAGISWYASPVGGTALANSTLLVTGTKYYAEAVGAGCVSAARGVDSVTILNPVKPEMNDTILCVGNSISIPIQPTGQTNSFTATQNGTGVPATGSNNISFTTTNTTNSVIKDTVIITPSLSVSILTCTSTKDTMVVSILPKAKVDSIANFVQCNNSTKSAINFTTPTTGGTVTYAWTNDKTSIGLAASGTGNIAAFIATNTGTAPVKATITVTPTISSGGVSCSGIVRTFTITVNPTAQINSLSNQVVCNGANTTAANFSTNRTGGTTTYAWTNNTTSIGLAASGAGNISAFTATNTTTAPITATITVTPTFTNGGVSCTGVDSTFTITVNPKGNVAANADKVLCNGATQAAINFSTNNTGGTTTYAWTNDNTAIGLAASGTGNINSFTVFNTSNDPDTAVVIVTPTFANGGTSCSGIKDTFYIVVNPVAKVDSISNKVVCNGSTVAVQTLTSSATGGIVTYSWTNNNTAIGLVASGTGNVPSFNATNTGTSAITATVTVTPTFTFSGVSCTGTARSYTITVNPPPIFNATNDKFVCNGSTTSAVVFSTILTGGTAVYNWTNDNTAIGLAASGTGNVPSFTATNNTTAPIYGSIVVTMNYTNAGLTCTSLKDTFDYVVNPTAIVNTINNQVVCNNGNTTAVNFGTTATGGTVTYAWTNNNPSTGLAASGNGNIAAFTATNNGTTPVTATITVTPTFTNGGVSCTGTARTFTITVNPTAQVNNISNQVVCNNANTTAVNFSTTHTGGTTTYAWTNNTTSIGLAASGAGNIAAFTAINTTTSPVTATITVTPTFTNGGVSCSGLTKTFTITVNPTATVNAIANQVVCNNSATTAVIFGTTATGGTVTYAWLNNTPSIGLAASGTGDITSFTGTNTTAAPVTATITVTPTFTNGGVSCTGTARTFTITVNPTATVTAIPNRVECNGSLVAAITPISPNTGGTVTYSWVNNTPAIGLAASGTGTIPSFTAANTTNAPIVATVTITPTFTNGAVSCVGTPFSYTITINPPPIFNATANQAACNGATAPAIALTTPLTGGVAVFTWTNSNTAIGLGAGGTGNIPSFTATNTTNAPISGAISVMMTYTNAGLTCTSLPQAFTYTINPTATINAVNNQTLCNRASTTAVNFSSPTTGGNLVYNWVNNNPAIGLAANGTGNIAVFTATNNTALPITATITVTPEFTNAGITCTGTVRTFTITVNPTPVTNFSINNAAQCLKNNQFVFTNTSTVANAYLWSLGDGSTATTTDVTKVYATDGSYIIKLVGTNSFGCKDSITKSIIVHPQPAIPTAVPVVNNGLHSNVIANSYAWYLNNTALSGASAQQYLPQTAGYYQVQVSTIQGCSQKSDSVYYIPERASAVRNGIEGQPMFVYPIPATGGNINIHFNAPLKHKVLCRMYTDVGQLLQTVEIPAGSRQFKLNVARYPSANYVLRFDDNYKVTKGLVVQVIN